MTGLKLMYFWLMQSVDFIKNPQIEARKSVDFIEIYGFAVDSLTNQVKYTHFCQIEGRSQHGNINFFQGNP